MTSRDETLERGIHCQFTSLQVMATFGSDTSFPAVMLHLQRYTYVFNCPPGLQKLCQNAGRIPKHADMLLTRLNWDVVGGMPGRVKAFRAESRISVRCVGVRGCGYTGPRTEKSQPLHGNVAELRLQVRRQHDMSNSQAENEVRDT
jgi:tRNase Z endonuclease